MITSASAGSESHRATSSARLGENLTRLVCPVCRGHLELHQQPDSAISVVQCKNCTRIYPVVDGIPVLLAERACLASATKV